MKKIAMNAGIVENEMSLEDQVCSLEWGKELNLFGVPQDSQYYWQNIDTELPSIMKGDSTEWGGDKLISAFTVGELFDLIPAFIDTKINEPFNGFFFQLEKRSSKNIQYIAHYVCDTEDPLAEFTYGLGRVHDENLANCLAKMLIYLIENKLLRME